MYRRRLNNVVCGLLALWLGIGMTTGLIEVAPGGKGAVGTAVLALLFGAPAILGWYLACRYAIHGVVVDEPGIVIRNGLRSHRLAWEEIDHFEYERCDPWPKIGVAVLHSGHRIAMTSLQRGYLGHFPERVVEALNRQRAEHINGGARVA